MAKPNYSFEKRQRELARKKKQEEKRSRHAKPKTPEDGSAPADPDTATADPAADKPVAG